MTDDSKATPRPWSQEDIQTVAEGIYEAGRKYFPDHPQEPPWSHARPSDQWCASVMAKAALDASPVAVYKNETAKLLAENDLLAAAHDALVAERDRLRRALDIATRALETIMAGHPSTSGGSARRDLARDARTRIREALGDG